MNAQKIKHPVSAWTEFPNTPQSDKELLVSHIVEFDDGSQITLLAIDPPDALERARNPDLTIELMIVNGKITPIRK